MSKRRRLVFGSALMVVAFVMLPYAYSRIASHGRCVTQHEQSGIDFPAVDNGSLTIACYNIAHGRGQSTTNWTGESRQLRTERLDDLADLIRSANADIVVLNEVDFDSSWSHSVNQAAYLAKAAGYPYWAEQRNLDFRVLCWTWRFGNAILSRLPIKESRVIDFPSHRMVESILAGKKRGLSCSIEFDGRLVQIDGVHLSHRSEAVRAKSTELLTASILAGDFNSTPTGFP